MTKQRQLSEAEQAARAQCGGLTRREWRAKTSKFHRPMTGRSGSFEVAGLFEGNTAEQTDAFPNELAALARFQTLSTNPNLISLNLIENQVIRGRNDEAVGLKGVVLYSLHKYGQEFANSKTVTIYKEPGGNATLTMKAIKASERLSDAYFSNKLEVVKHRAEGGEPWWERRA